MPRPPGGRRRPCTRAGAEAFDLVVGGAAARCPVAAGRAPRRRRRRRRRRSARTWAGALSLRRGARSRSDRRAARRARGSGWRLEDRVKGQRSAALGLVWRVTWHPRRCPLGHPKENRAARRAHRVPHTEESKMIDAAGSQLGTWRGEQSCATDQHNKRAQGREQARGAPSAPRLMDTVSKNVV
jgi:hypothetical protein